jgi:two-component system phosphate regulon response regulator PhoB
MRDNILIVEDESRLAMQVRESAGSYGFRAQHTNNGLEALALVHRHMPSLVLLDWSIEGITGIEVCRRIRADPICKTMPIIMISGRGDEDDRIHGLLSGADDYLVKPFSMAELFARVRGLLRRARPGRSLSTLSVGDIKLDAATMRVTRGGEELRLRSREFELLHFLISRPREVVSAERL